MTNPHELRLLSDDELLRRLSQLVTQSRRVESELVAHIGEVDERRLYARSACSSMFVYCIDVLHLSEAEAFLRIGAARAARRFPVLLAMLADGRLHLSGIGKLAAHLTEENAEWVLGRAVHRSKRQIEELVAELAPKPDLPPSVRKLPTRPDLTFRATTTAPQLRPDAVKNEMLPPFSAGHQSPVPIPAPPAVIQPLAPARYKVQFTASACFREKMERLTALMRPSVPDGDLARILEEAVTEKLERLEAKRFANTNRPRKNANEVETGASSRYIPAPIKRIVWDRDGNQCTFIDGTGRRCPERFGLEFHHQSPYGLGGGHSADNVVLMCRAHNVYRAELDYGRKKMDRYRRSDRVSECAAAYS